MAKMLCGFVAALFLALGTADAQEFKPSEWTYELTGPGSGIQHLGEAVRLFYRPHLVSKSEWSPNTTLTFDWQPPKLPPKADDGRQYGDHLVIFFSSDGSFQEQRSYEMKNGLAVRFDSVTGNVGIATALNGDFTTIGTGKIDLPAEGIWEISVVDKGETVSVTVNGTEVVAKIPADARKGKKWGFYNREPVANATNLSIISKIVKK